jgi:hypothetical protein
MKGKLLALAALSAASLTAYAADGYIYQSNPTSGQYVAPSAQVIQPSAPVISSSGDAVVSGSPAVVAPAPAVVGATPVVVTPVAVAPVATAPATRIQGQSGPGAIDQTHPGLSNGTGLSSRDAGTSSAGG